MQPLCFGFAFTLKPTGTCNAACSHAFAENFTVIIVPSKGLLVICRRCWA